MYPTASVLALPFFALPFCAALQSVAARPTDVARATVIIARAELLQRASDFPEKAQLYEEASRILPLTDARASSALRQAGLIHHQMHSSVRALQLLEQAAELAAVRGVPAEAAYTYVKALSIALETDAKSNARRFIDRALTLTNSPTVPEADRHRILRAISIQTRHLNARKTVPEMPALDDET